MFIDDSKTLKLAETFSKNSKSAWPSASPWQRTVHPGDGKSMILTKCALYFAGQDENVIIACANEILVEQMNQYLDVFCQDYIQGRQIQIINIADLSAVEVRGKVLILDEFDYMVKNHMVYFKTKRDGNETITGLVMSILAKRIIMMSATTSHFDIKYMTRIHGLT